MSDSVTQLGYLGFAVRDLGAWERFATQVLGLEVVARREDGAFSLRMDEYAHRFFIDPSPADDLAVIGWECEDDAALERLAHQVERFGTEVREGTAAEVDRRRVRRLVKFADPAGIETELYWGPAREDAPFRSPLVASGFVGGALGLGHLVVSARDQRESVRFYREALGFRLSDRIVTEIHGFHVDIIFLHANQRHHSLAIGEQQRKRLHHFMLEVRSMDDVGLAFDRALRSDVRIMQTLGRHPNDRMFSFYARTPSGFQFEYGWGGRLVDDATWQDTTYDHISEWGHHPPAFLAPRPDR